MARPRLGTGFQRRTGGIIRIEFPASAGAQRINPAGHLLSDAPSQRDTAPSRRPLPGYHPHGAQMRRNVFSQRHGHATARRIVTLAPIERDPQAGTAGTAARTRRIGHAGPPRFKTLAPPARGARNIRPGRDWRPSRRSKGNRAPGLVRKPPASPGSRPRNDADRQQNHTPAATGARPVLGRRVSAAPPSPWAAPAPGRHI